MYADFQGLPFHLSELPRRETNPWLSLQRPHIPPKFHAEISQYLIMLKGPEGQLQIFFIFLVRSLEWLKVASKRWCTYVYGVIDEALDTCWVRYLSNVFILIPLLGPHEGRLRELRGHPIRNLDCRDREDNPLEVPMPPLAHHVKEG